MRVTHLGHSCLVVELADRRILVDPGAYAAGFEELTGLDAILVTHQHADHLDQQRLPALVRANPGARLLADPQSAALLTDAGLAVQPLRAGEDVQVGEVTVSPRGELHAVNHAWVPTVSNVGVRLEAPGEPVLFHPGDAYDADPGAVDLLAVPINAPWCAVRDAIAFVRRIAPAGIVPIHDGLLNAEPGRALYLTHITSFGGDVTLHDLAGRGAVTIG